MEEKAFQQILSLNPKHLQLASDNAAVRKWNLDILDDLVQTAVDRFPPHPSKEELASYRTLNRRLCQFSKQFVERGDEKYGVLAEHIKELVDKIHKEEDPRIRRLFSHHMTKKILKFGSVFDLENANHYRLQLVKYVKGKLIVAIPQLKKKEDREKVRTLLENLVAIQHAMDRFDIDGALDEVISGAIKQFLFNGVISHHIYQSLLNYEEGSFPSNNPDLCFEAADGIHQFIFRQLVPFLQDHDVEPCREDVEKIVGNLRVLNNEFSATSCNLLSPTINILESFL